MLKLIPVLAVAAFAGSAAAQTYTTKVIARDLDRPTGISVSLAGKVFFTELPTPGVGTSV